MILRVIQNLETTPMFKIPKQSQLDYIVVPMDSRRRHIFQKDCSVSFHSTSDEIVLVGRQPKLEVFERWVKTMIGERTISPKVIVVVDTNIFGHREEQRYLDQIYTNDDIAIGIPERVRAELDRMKSFKNDTAFTARDALRNIGACSLMPNKTIAQLDGQYPKIRFDIKKEDDEIVSYALYLAEQVGKKVALVTRDQGMKQRAVAYAKYLDVFPGMRSFVSSTYVASDIDSLTENVKRIAIDQDAVSDDDAESWETVSDSEDEM
jgi:rRNA-processing protein FCF1